MSETKDKALLYQPVIVKLFEDGHITWAVRIVRNGDHYGRHNCLVHECNDPLVEFYDTRYLHTDLGQFVSRYSATTFLYPKSYFLSKEALEKQFGSDEALGIRYDESANDGHGGSVFPDGSSAVMCFAYANWIQKVLDEQHVKVVGFYTINNPDCDIAREGLVSGHDFAIVNERWLIDPWFRLVEGDMRKPVVHDLRDPDDVESVLKIYGDPAYWEESSSAKNTKPSYDGLCLDGGVPEWSISAKAHSVIAHWLRGYLSV